MVRLRFSDVILLFLLFSCLLKKGHCQDKIFNDECFSEVENGQPDDPSACEKSRINVKGTFYKCESAKRFNKPIKRIDFLVENTLVLAGKQSFAVDESTPTAEVKPIRMVIPQRTEFFDGKGHRYLGGSNIVYVQKIQDNGIMEVITHNAPESYNTIAVDDVNDILFILSQYEDENFGLKRESLYVAPINSMNTKTDKIKADLYKDLENVTTIAFNHQKKFLYIGLQLPNGEGKLIKVKGQADDPCAISDETKEEISSAIADFTEKIFNVLNKTASFRNSEGGEMNINYADELLQLKWEKRELETQLNATMLQLSRLKDTYFPSAIAHGGLIAQFGQSSGGASTGSAYPASGEPYPQLGPYPYSGGPYPSSGGPYPSSGGPYPPPGGFFPPQSLYPLPGERYPPSVRPYPITGGENPSPRDVYPSDGQYDNTNGPQTNVKFPSNVFINIYLTPHQHTN